uniref:Uncharacterized protein n=1 Tax=Anguilla anguilla TaxID=7936 RepID=A0A0E9T6H0_ANGAN
MRFYFSGNQSNRRNIFFQVNPIVPVYITPGLLLMPVY